MSEKITVWPMRWKHAATIASLTAERDRLREALQAFLDFDDLDIEAKRPDAFQLILRRARAALKETSDD